MKHAFLALAFACALPGFAAQSRPDAIHGTWRSDASNYWNRNGDERRIHGRRWVR